MPARTLVGVVGHVEWVQFACVQRVPRAGEIVHATSAFDEPAGGGAVAAVQLRKLAGGARFFTAMGDDVLAQQAAARLSEHHGVRLHAGARPGPQRRCFTFQDAEAERTITVLGERIVPLRADSLPWDELGELDGVYVTGGDADAVRAARAARMLVATPRALTALVASGVQLDVLVGSATDAGEVYERGMLDPEPRVVVRTRGEHGGTWEVSGEPPAWVGSSERSGTWAPTPLPGTPADAYGCGDSFAAGLTYGLAAGMALPDAIGLGARCGAACLCGRGPYEGQLALA